MGWAKALAGFARVLVSNLIPLLTVLFPVANVFASREPIFARAAGLLSRTQTETPTADGRGPLDTGVVLSSVRVEKHSGDCKAGHPDRLASQRLQMVLALPGTLRPTTPAR